MESSPDYTKIICVFSPKYGRKINFRVFASFLHNLPKKGLRLGAVIDVKVRFARNILPMLVIFSLFFCDPKSTRSKIAPL